MNTFRAFAAVLKALEPLSSAERRCVLRAAEAVVVSDSDFAPKKRTGSKRKRNPK